jgi:hypothetical protein
MGRECCGLSGSAWGGTSDHRPPHLIVLGSIVALIGLGLAAGGGFLLWADRTQPEGGYLTTPTETTSNYALTRERLEADAGGARIWNDDWQMSLANAH